MGEGLYGCGGRMKGGGWDSADRIIDVGQRGGQLLDPSSDFGRVMSASDSFLRTPICHRISR